MQLFCIPPQRAKYIVWTVETSYKENENQQEARNQK